MVQRGQRVRGCLMVDEVVTITQLILESYKSDLEQMPSISNLLKAEYLYILGLSYKRGMSSSGEFIMAAGAIGLSSILAKSIL